MDDLAEHELERNQDAELYGKDAAEWLSRWDAGRIVFSVDMGGMGPGYEQCIQIMAAEVLRDLLAIQPSVADMNDTDKWRAIFKKIDADVMQRPVVKSLRCSGAQWGAACNLATVLYRRGPVDAFNDPAVKNDRLIQVSNDIVFKSSEPQPA